MRDAATDLPIFTTFSIELVCQSCKDAGNFTGCKHLLWMVPSWQSSEKHVRLKQIMQDRPDLIRSELAGLSFDALQQAFRKCDIDAMFETVPPPMQLYEPIYIFVDPACGGPQSDYGILSCTRYQGVHCVIGLDALGGCKDPEKQFQLLTDHIKRIQSIPQWSNSSITLFVEANLGFESEHHQRAMMGRVRNISFYRDMQRQRVGIYTSHNVKHCMCTLLNALLRERRVCVRTDNFVSSTPENIKQLLREELEMYSYQFKEAASVFQKSQVALSGKIGGSKDDLCVLLQLSVYWVSSVLQT